MHNSNFENIVQKVIEISANPDLIEIEYVGCNTLWVGYIYLDNYDDYYNDNYYDFEWIIGKQLNEQSKETQETINLLKI